MTTELQIQPRVEPSTSYPGGIPALMTRLRQMKQFASLCEEQAPLLERTHLNYIAGGQVMVKPGDAITSLWIHLEGHIQISYLINGSQVLILDSRGNELMGETPALSGMPAKAQVEVIEDSLLLQFDLEDFWQLMTDCHAIRQAVLGGMAMRIQETQFTVLQREKMISIGTTAAGLMHELNNPSAAAQRASAQLGKNIASLQEISMRFCDTEISATQSQCLHQLQESAYAHKTSCSLSTLEQSEKEEELAGWLESQNVEDAWELAAVLVSRGLDSAALQCAREELPQQLFVDTLHWLGALSSSLGLLQTVEQSVTRINELVKAVKMYSSGFAANQDLNIHETIHSAVVILLHKIRAKGIKLEKSFAPDLPLVHVATDGIPQIWTNLLDNAIDAVPDGGKITITTAVDGADVKVTIGDNGSGIPPEVQKHIFEPFFTTKEPGKGTGLGLDIAYRKIRECRGSITVESVPGDTRFVVKLPAKVS
jgi:signal transduction histidine kinase